MRNNDEEDDVVTALINGVIRHKSTAAINMAENADHDDISI